jgi:hypothetical protein
MGAPLKYFYPFFLVTIFLTWSARTEIKYNSFYLVSAKYIPMASATKTIKNIQSRQKLTGDFS